METTVRYVEGTPVLDIDSKFVTAVATQIRAELEELALTGKFRYIILNMPVAKLIDGFAVENLYSVHSLLRRKSGALVIVAPNGEVQNFIHLHKHGSDLIIHDTVESAALYTVSRKRERDDL